jgi:hypothetical protein
LRALSSPGVPPEAPPAEPPADPVIETTVPVETAPIEDPEVPEPVPQRPTRRPPRPASGPGSGGEEAERGLRGLVGSGSSQVSVGAALRARDAARPTDAHVADAEENLPIVRRNWTPREDLPRRP